jgi:hypothetical protein
MFCLRFLDDPLLRAASSNDGNILISSITKIAAGLP